MLRRPTTPLTKASQRSGTARAGRRVGAERLSRGSVSGVDIAPGATAATEGEHEAESRPAGAEGSNGPPVGP